MEAIRLAVIGTGRAGLIHARNLAQRIPAARLVGACDSNRQALEQIGQELGVRSLWTDYREAVTSKEVDAVVIVVPTFLHREVACLAAKSGKHVFLEKPMALSVEECRAINREVQQAGVKLQIGFMRRFDEGFKHAKELLESGEMGRVTVIKSTGRGPGGPGPWMYDLRKSNGIIAEVNSHDIDSLLWFTGLPVRRIYAQGHNFKCTDAREAWPDFYDTVVATLGFDGGAMGVIDGACPAHYGYDARVEILCEKGVLFIGSYQQQTAIRVTVDGQVQGQAVKSWRNLFKDAYLAEMEHFVDCVAHDKPTSVTGEDGLKAVEAVVAINQSIRDGRVVELQSR